MSHIVDVASRSLLTFHVMSCPKQMQIVLVQNWQHIEGVNVMQLCNSRSSLTQSFRIHLLTSSSDPVPNASSKRRMNCRPDHRSAYAVIVFKDQLHNRPPIASYHECKQQTAPSSSPSSVSFFMKVYTCTSGSRPLHVTGSNAPWKTSRNSTAEAGRFITAC